MLKNEFVEFEAARTLLTAAARCGLCKWRFAAWLSRRMCTPELWFRTRLRATMEELARRGRAASTPEQHEVHLGALRNLHRLDAGLPIAVDASVSYGGKMPEPAAPRGIEPPSEFARHRAGRNMAKCAGPIRVGNGEWHDLRPRR